jgi:hypothetical protein
VGFFSNKETFKMERTVNTKEELKAAIENRERAIVIGNDNLAKKITRFQKIKSEELQAAEDTTAINGGEAAVAMPSVLTNAATGTAWAPHVAAFAIMVLGGLAYYALTKNYDVLVEGGDSIKFHDGEPKIGGRVKFVMKRPIFPY